MLNMLMVQQANDVSVHLAQITGGYLKAFQQLAFHL